MTGLKGMRAKSWQNDLDEDIPDRQYSIYKKTQDKRRHLQPRVEVHTCNPSTEKAEEAERSADLSSRISEQHRAKLSQMKNYTDYK